MESEGSLTRIQVQQPANGTYPKRESVVICVLKLSLDTSAQTGTYVAFSS
jgi:hypothetical protein